MKRPIVTEHACASRVCGRHGEVAQRLSPPHSLIANVLRRPYHSALFRSLRFKE